MKMIDTNFPLYLLAFIMSFVITTVSVRLLIPILKKKAEQPIYKEGPSWHIAKSGTPTLGGVGFLIAISVTLSLSALYLGLNKNNTASLSLILCLCYSVLNSVVGIIDDLTKLRRKKNGGLTPKAKLLLQLILTIAFLTARRLIIPDSNLVTFSFGTYDFGILYYPIAALILIGITKCANLTDGIDGLASSVAFAASLSLFYLSCALSPDISFVSSSLIGASVGFLIFNLHPAKIFMGDTGSLLFGSIIASMAISLGNPLIAIFVGGVYVIEGVSVILQVFWYKSTGKRIFKMAPLHHHLEKCGWTENRICIVAMLITFLLSIPAYIFYLP